MSEHERCSQCDFDGSRFDDTQLLVAIRQLAPRWRDAISTCGSDVSTRPEPDVWSALEYAAHSRDITALHVFGVEQALVGSEPDFGDIAGDELISGAAVDYGSLDPDEVVGQLEAQCAALADVADVDDRSEWGRGLTVGGERIDVRRLLEHALHDSHHHLDDIDRGLVEIRG